MCDVEFTAGAAEIGLDARRRAGSDLYAVLWDSGFSFDDGQRYTRTVVQSGGASPPP
jgi:hypothetical protein